MRLTQIVRNFWRRYKERWTDGEEVRVLFSVDGRAITQDSCEDFLASFSLLYGDLHRLLPMGYWKAHRRGRPCPVSTG